MESTSSAPKKLIYIRKYKVNNTSHTLTWYAADGWCAPCTRIKPHVEKLVVDGVLIPMLGEEKVVEKGDTAVKDMKIPFFELVDKKGERVWAIQTSDSKQVDEFLGC